MPFVGQTGQILFQISYFTLYFDILAKKGQKNVSWFFLGDLTWNRPQVEDPRHQVLLLVQHSVFHPQQAGLILKRWEERRVRTLGKQLAKTGSAPSETLLTSC